MFRNPLEFRNDSKPKNQSTFNLFGSLGSGEDEPDTEIANLKKPTTLKAPVGDAGQNRRRDVAKTEQLLGEVGTLDLKKTDGPTGFWGTRTSDATKMFQKQNSLKVDGQINPDGETIRTLGKLAGQVDKALAQPKAMPPAPKKPKPLNEGVIGETTRAARYLASQKGIGDFSKFMVDGIETDGDKAIAETVDLYRQTAEMNQDQADALIQKITPRLSLDNAKRLQSAMMSAEHVSSDALSIGVWPDGNDHLHKPNKEPIPTGEDFIDSATDDEIPSNDNLEKLRDTRDMIMKHLIEGGQDPEDAKKFLDLIQWDSNSEDSNNALINAMSWLSGKINSVGPVQKGPQSFIGGIRG